MRLLTSVAIVSLLLSACVEGPRQTAETPPEQTKADVLETELFDPSTLDVLKPGIDPARADEIRERLEALDTRGDPKGAAEAIENLEADIDAVYVETAPIRGVLITQKASVQSTLGEHDSVLETLATAKTYFDSEDLQRSSDYLSIRSLEANTLVQTGDAEAGIEILEEIAAVRKAGLPANDPKVGQDYLNLAAALYRLSRYDEALDYSQRSVEISEANLDVEDAQSLDNHVTNLASLSAIANTAGETDLALSSGEQASALASQHMEDDNPTLGLALSNYGNALNNVQRFVDAEEVLRRAVDARRSQLGNDHERVAVSLSNLASSLLYQKKFEQAEAVFMQAFAILEAKGEPQYAWAGMVLDNAAKAASDQGRYDIASERYDRAKELLIKVVGPDHARIGLSHLSHVEALFALGKDEEAIRIADEAQRVIDAAFQEGNTYRTIATTMRAFAGSRTDIDDSLARVRPVLNELEQKFVQTRFDQAGLSELSESAALSLSHIAEIAARADDAEMLLKTLQLTALGDLSEADQRAASRAFTSDPELDALQRRLTSAKSERLSLESDISVAIAEGRDDDLVDLRKRLKQIVETIETDTQTLIDQGGDATLAFTLMSVSNVQKTLDNDEGLWLVSTAQRPKSLLITQESVIVSVSDDTTAHDLKRSVSSVREKLQDQSIPLIASDDDIQVLSDVMSSESREALAKLGNIRVVDDGLYSSLPLTLLSDPASPDRFWGERAAISHLPSVGSLSRKRVAPISGNSRFLGIGDPVLAPAETGAETYASIADLSQSGTYLRGGIADADELRELPSLPGTRLELESVASTFPRRQRTLLLGDEATEEGVRGLSLKDFDVVSFATHGLLPGESGNGREPALVLTPPRTVSVSDDDGLLTADEISQLGFGDALIILSACNTAAAGRTGRPLTGLPSAFYAAGAGQLMISHWPVRDDAAAFLSTRTVNYMRDGSDTAQALRQAMADLRASDLPNANHPSVWAPFVIVGG